MPLSPGTEIGKTTRFKPGQSGNPGGRPAGSLNVSTFLKADVLARLGDVARGIFETDQFTEQFRAALEKLAARDPLAALRSTAFLWPTATVSQSYPQQPLFNLSPERLRLIAASVIGNPAATDALSLDAGNGAETPHELNGDESRKPETSAPPVAKPVAESEAAAPVGVYDRLSAESLP